MTNSIGMKLTLIPPGEFMMGAPDSDATPYPWEKPQHQVKISKAFYLGKYAVTVGQFRTFVEATGCKTNVEITGQGGVFETVAGARGVQKPEFIWKSPPFKQDDRHPVVLLTWSDTVKFCGWLADKEKSRYRLPTEAEWEHACRAGTTSRYFWGEDVEEYPAYGNVADSTYKADYPNARESVAGSDGFVYTAPVGTFKPNPFGLYDMLGNVSQFCSDFFEPRPYSPSPAVDPHGPESGRWHSLRGSASHERPWHRPRLSAVEFRFRPGHDASGLPGRHGDRSRPASGFVHERQQNNTLV